MNNISNKVINNLRYLAATTISNAGSGHTGISLGATPIFYSLYAAGLKYSPKEPQYFNRDRFVLCAGHASALLYTSLHAFGFDFSADDLKNYRKMGSKTTGHPSFNNILGVDATGGPLGQGIPMAVGMAIAERKLAARFNKPGCEIVNHHTIAFAGDGSMMEGMTNEASSLAGTLGLNKLIVIYDSNNITIEGNTNLAFTENVLARYRALNWNTMEVDNGEDASAIISAINMAKQSKDKPTIIKVNTQIGYGTPFQGNEKIHGKALTKEELQKTKENLGVSCAEFELDASVKEHLSQLIKAHIEEIEKEKQQLKIYKQKYNEEYIELERWLNDYYSMQVNWNDFARQESDEATRVSGGHILNKLANEIPNLICGSADVSSNTGVQILLGGMFSRENPHGRNIAFGVREHAMGAICNGIAMHGGFRIVCSTFMVFSDYLRHAIRMSAMMKVPVIYVFSHDSIGVGEDGKTHQPIEFNAMYRATPDLNFFRPADRREVKVAYKIAMESQMPSILALSRQKLKNLNKYSKDVANKGAYFISAPENAKAIIYSCGSELQLAIEASEVLAKKGIGVSVVSVLSKNVLDSQSLQYRQKILQRDIPVRIAVEASSDDMWRNFIGIDGAMFGIKQFGETASSEQIYQKHGITVANIVKTIQNALK